MRAISIVGIFVTCVAIRREVYEGPIGGLQKIVNKLEVRAEIRTRIVSRHLNVGLLCHYFPETSFIFAVQ